MRVTVSGRLATACFGRVSSGNGYGVVRYGEVGRRHVLYRCCCRYVMSLGRWREMGINLWLDGQRGLGLGVKSEHVIGE